MNWVDRVRQDATLRRITYSDGTTADVHITDIASNVTVQGTPVNKSNMQNLDDRVESNKANLGINSSFNTFSTSSTYSVGDYVIYKGVLYKCKSAVTTAGAWNSNKWQQVNIIDFINELKNIINSNYTTLNSLITTNKQSTDGEIETINNSIENLTEVELYNNTNGTLNEITLSMNASEFKYLEIFYSRTNTSGFNSTKVYSPNNKRVALTINEKGAPIVVYTGIIKISENKILFEGGGGLALKATRVGDTVVTDGTATANEIKIYRVVGIY